MASKNISFQTIPSSIRVPGVYTEFNTKLAVRNLPVNPQKVIIVAQKCGDGTQAPLKPVQLFSDTEAANLFGPGSQAHRLARQAIKNNAYVHLSVIALDDAKSSSAATASITIVGTATAQGILCVRIAGERYQCIVAPGDAPGAQASSMATVINAASDAAVTATVTGAKLVLRANNKGTCGNEIAVSASISAHDVSITVTPMTGGAVNPDIDEALAVIAGVHYHLIVSPYSDANSAQKLADHLNTVSNSIEQRGAIGIIGWRGSMSSGTTLTSHLNNGRVVATWLKGATQDNGMLAASMAAVLAFEEDPARPLGGLRINGIEPPDISDRPTFTEFNTALYHGLAPLEVVNDKVAIMRVITTYTKNSTGSDDPSLLDITTIRTLDYARMAINQRLRLRFPREKLCEKTAAKVRSEILDVLTKMEELEIVEQVVKNKNKLIVERDLADVNRLNCAIPADVVNGLHVIANRIDLYL